MTEASSLNQIRALLAADHLVDPDTAILETLTGGVSCDVVKVIDAGNSFVVKRALPKLRVEAEWFADVKRNKYEHRYLSVVNELIPGSVPKVIHFNDEQQFFCMEFLEGDWRNWKSDLLNGVCQIRAASEAGRILGLIHRLTSEDQELGAEFATDQGFFDLRLEPYLVTTGKKHEALRPIFEKEVKRITHTKHCLVHGDYSPKNILVNESGIKILDCEVAWFGDPSFDLAFLLNHLLLKSIYHAPIFSPLDEMYSKAVESYFFALAREKEAADELNAQTARLLLMLLLARVDGKSPAEYLADNPVKQDFIRNFVTQQLVREGNRLNLKTVSSNWFTELRKEFS